MRGDTVEVVQVCCKDDDRGVMMSNEVSPGDGERGEVMCDDEMNTRTQNKSDDYTTPTPSSGEAGKRDDEKGDQDVSVCGSVTNDNKQECKIIDGVCINGCRTRTISYTIKKRVMNKKTLLWYDRSVRITKPICVKTRYDAQSNLAKRV